MTEFERVIDLCKENDTNLNRMCKDLGISRTLFYSLRDGRTKHMQEGTVKKLSDYFGISPEEFLRPVREAQLDINNADNRMYADDIIDIIQDLRDRPELKVLFKRARNVSPEQIRAISHLLEIQARERNELDD